MYSQPKKVFFGKYAFQVSKDVYEPAEDTFLLANNLSVKESERVLDLGTGCGILAVLAAGKAKRVVAVDVNPHAVTCAKKNAALNRVAAKIEVRKGDLFDAVAFDEKFDLILFNAPYLPVEEDEGKSWIEKAWAGGQTGRSVIDRFIDTVSAYLTEKGRVLLVQSSLSDVEETLNRFLQHNLHAAIVGEKKSAFEEIVLIEAKQKVS
jgi:release factor glutamine methyltransferase